LLRVHVTDVTHTAVRGSTANHLICNQFSDGAADCGAAVLKLMQRGERNKTEVAVLGQFCSCIVSSVQGCCQTHDFARANSLSEEDVRISSPAQRNPARANEVETFGAVASLEKNRTFRKLDCCCYVIQLAKQKGLIHVSRFLRYGYGHGA